MLARLVSSTKWGVYSAAIMGLLAGSAAAFQPFGGRNLMPFFSQYPADYSRLYETRTIPTPPYFSLHPPVYYSRPVARTYGYSPYAYPPQIMTPELALPAPTPKVIQNRFAPPLKNDAKKAAKDQVAATPVRVVNPFVPDTEAVAKR